MAVPRHGARVVIYVVLTAQMLPEEFADRSGYDLYGPHHVNGAWASRRRRTRVVIRVVYTAQIALRLKLGVTNVSQKVHRDVRCSPVILNCQ